MGVNLQKNPADSPKKTNLQKQSHGHIHLMTQFDRTIVRNRFWKCTNVLSFHRLFCANH